MNILITIIILLIISLVINSYINRNKRFQETNKLDQLFRYRYYLKIPFIWIYSITFGDTTRQHWKALWKILIGIEQINMKWYYTQDEVLNKIK